MHWYVDVLKKYAVFNGRARRREFWMYNLFNIIALVVLAGIGLQARTTSAMIPYYLYLAAIFIPSIAVTVRRLHDINQSGWLMLIGLIPFLGGIAMLVITCAEGDAVPNAHGPNPKPTPAHL
ncbi:DUF805 domain-containing protein [Actinacidiphila paucisporea]|uniref:Uncharacterized membrane protein YhaH, DUF805 family n=1 Tax=Actinacidiphila paucisporea TaxID=310782 RepID=A0A1M7MI17_9ACTN|nr:DUF805 domain-containing protein [Actinacidiphila paucisporea]SHM90046.1 Uncharacterized membrane protein YhaH, DUF805 family [Actinacidiphila paucisporea]